MLFLMSIFFLLQKHIHQNPTHMIYLMMVFHHTSFIIFNLTLLLNPIMKMCPSLHRSQLRRPTLNLLYSSLVLHKSPTIFSLTPPLLGHTLVRAQTLEIHPKHTLLLFLQSKHNLFKFQQLKHKLLLLIFLSNSLEL